MTTRHERPQSTIQPDHLVVQHLGECRYQSPLRFESRSHSKSAHFVSDAERVRFNVRISPDSSDGDELAFELAGPRERIYFQPSATTAAIVTCGGLSPGLNNVIRSAYYELSENYGVKRIVGIRNGYLGLNPESGLEPIELSRTFVESIDKLGGTVLGSSRGPQAPGRMADFLQQAEIDILFCLGGDGTQRGAHALFEDITRRRASIAIVGIPKTIDNDIPFVRMSFGFPTSLERAAEVIRGAHVEARDAVNGIGLVKLMRRTPTGTPPRYLPSGRRTHRSAAAESASTCGGEVAVRFFQRATHRLV